MGYSNLIDPMLSLYCGFRTIINIFDCFTTSLQDVLCSVQWLWGRIPAAYRAFHTFRDFLEAYQASFLKGCTGASGRGRANAPEIALVLQGRNLAWRRDPISLSFPIIRAYPIIFSHNLSFYLFLVR